jgi:hypothetical protein
MKIFQNKAVEELYNQCGFQITNLIQETESADYAACQFVIAGKKVISRKAKQTPKKAGQFVTFWKRKANGPIEPFEESDDFDFFVVNAMKDGREGQFVFPKSVLIKKGIISTKHKEGKRAFRVYSIWDIANSKQAEKTKHWQLNYFFEIEKDADFSGLKDLYTRPKVD